jgi:hypothetical protein
MTESHIVSEITGFPVKPMPGPTRWLRRRFCWVMMMTGVLLTACTGSYIPFVVSIAITLAVTISIVCHIRCPQCSQRLEYREVKETVYCKRLYYDCQTCRITWQSELVNDERDWS